MPRKIEVALTAEALSELDRGAKAGRLQERGVGETVAVSQPG